MGEWAQTLVGMLAVAGMIWLALGRVPVMGGVVKGILKLAFLSAPLVAVTIFVLFSLFQVPGWFAPTPAHKAVKPVPVMVVTSDPAAPERAPEPPVKTGPNRDDPFPVPRGRPDE